MPYHRTLFSIVLLYAAHTLPLYFATFAMPAILRAEHISLAIIGLLGCLMLPLAFKFLWAPWLDRHYYPPWGKRKTWIMVTQFFIVGFLACLTFITPSEQPILLFCLLFLVTLTTATQDIACGAYVIEQLKIDQRPFGNYAQVIGTTFGSATGGALILFCYPYLGWTHSILFLFSLSVVMLILLFSVKEEKKTIYLEPEWPSFANFWQRFNTRHLLYMCLIYRGCEGLVMGMQQPFLVDIPISVSRIGLVMGISNLTLGLIAAGIASLLFKPLGGWKMLVILGCFRSIAYFALFVVAYLHINNASLIFSIVIINMATRLMEMLTLYTIFMNHCSSQQAATDFSILVCGELIIYMIGINLSGYIAEQVGYSGLFLLGSLLSIPSVVISAQLIRKVTQHPLITPVQSLSPQALS